MSRYKYYINTVLQDLIPEVPDKTAVLKLDDETCTGTSDGVTIRHDPFKVELYVKTQAEVLADHNEWIMANETVQVDESGDYILDEYGRYIYSE